MHVDVYVKVAADDNRHWYVVSWSNTVDRSLKKIFGSALVSGRYTPSRMK